MGLVNGMQETLLYANNSVCKAQIIALKQFVFKTMKTVLALCASCGVHMLCSNMQVHYAFSMHGQSQIVIVKCSLHSRPIDNDNFWLRTECTIAETPASDTVLEFVTMISDTLPTHAIGVDGILINASLIVSGNLLVVVHGAATSCMQTLNIITFVIIPAMNLIILKNYMMEKWLSSIILWF